MDQKEQMLLKNHDLKNYMSAAYSYLDLFTSEHPQLSDNEHIVTTKNILSTSFEKSKEIHALFRDMLKAAVPSHIKKVKVQTILNDVAKPFYDKIRGIYTLEIVDTYTTLDEPKFARLNMNETMEAEENIFSNAFKAHATHIDVHQEMKEMFMVSTYADNGDGMTQDQIDRFMMATFGDGISCGIGSRNIMRCAVNHKSPLTISSEPGKGTTIRIVTPYTV